MAEWKWHEDLKSWRLELWVNGKRHTLTCKGTKREALDYEARRRLELKAAPEKGRAASKVAPHFATFCVDTYKPHAKSTLRASTWSVRQYRLKPLINFFGDYRLDELTTAQVEEYKQRRTTGPKKVDKVSCNSELNDLGAILTYARHLELPVADVKIKRYPTRKRKGSAKPYTRQEVELILAGAAKVSSDFHVLVKFIAETGCRRSEPINLPKDRLDLDAGMARVWSDVEGDTDEDEDEYEVKSSDREVTLPGGLVAALRTHLATKLVASSPWVFPARKGRSVAGERTKEPGDKYTEWPKHFWRAALRHANKLRPKGSREINGGPHRLRHTYASLFLQALPDLFALAKVLGHSHGRTTELYAHLLPDHLAKTRGVVVFGDKTPNPASTPPGDRKRGRGPRERPIL